MGLTIMFATWTRQRKSPHGVKKNKDSEHKEEKYYFLKSNMFHDINFYDEGILLNHIYIKNAKMADTGNAPRCCPDRDLCLLLTYNIT